MSADDTVIIVWVFNPVIAKQGTLETVDRGQAVELVRTGRARYASEADVADEAASTDAVPPAAPETLPAPPATPETPSTSAAAEVVDTPADKAAAKKVTTDKKPTAPAGPVPNGPAQP